jgi:hypothetical protein
MQVRRTGRALCVSLNDRESGFNVPDASEREKVFRRSRGV